MGTTILRIALLGAVAIALSACGDNAPKQPGPNPPGPEQPNPEQPNPEQPNPEQPNPEQPDPEQPDPELHTLVIGPGTGSIPIGAALSFLAQLLDENGEPANYDGFTFSSSPTGVLTIDSEGRAFAESLGTATVTVHAESLTAQSTIEVTPQSTSAAGASWEPTTPPAPSTVSDFTVAADGRYYALINQRILESVDSGLTWRPIYEAFTNECRNALALSTLAAHPTTAARLYLGCYSGGHLYESHDRGRTWSHLSSAPMQPSNTSKLVTYEQHPEVLSWGANVSFDGGRSWQTVPNASTYVSSDEASTLINSTGFQISRDAGLTWQPLPPPPTSRTEGCTGEWGIARYSNRLLHSSGLAAVVQSAHCQQYPAYPARYAFRLAISIDFGDTWQSIPLGERSTPDYFSTAATTHLAYSSADPGTIYYYLPGSNLMRIAAVSIGGSVTDFDVGVTSSSSFRLTALEPGTLLVSSSASSPYAIVQDFGASIRLGNGNLGQLRASHIGQLRIPPTGLPELFDTTLHDFRPIGDLVGFTAVAARAGTVDSTQPSRLLVGPRPNYYAGDTPSGVTYDEGRTWTVMTPSYARSQSPADPRIWYAATENGAVLTSTDNASTFHIAARIPSQSQIMAFAASHQDSLKAYALSDDGVRITTNGGQTWPWASDGLGHVGDADIVVDPTSDSVVYVGGHAGVWKTTNSGVSWQAHNTGLRNTEVTSLAISADGATLLAGTNDGGAYRSLDSGNTWEWVVNGLQNYRINDVIIDPRDDNVMYAATQGGVYKSTNKGSTWTLASAGLYSPFVQWLELAGDSQRLYLGTSDHGVYRGEVSSRTGSEFRTQALP